MKIRIPGVDEEYIHETMSNGLEVYLVPNKKVKNFYMTLTTKFGSLTTEFKKSGEKSYTKLPNGVAHFLEHLAFKMEDGDAMEVLANLGSQANAFTSFKETCYEVYGFNKFKENLNYLLDFVETPYFKRELVEAEKGIITEEVKMYEDSPATKLNFELNKCLFHNDNRRFLVSGTVKDVKKTTLKDIENAYYTFYHPANMFVIITGNFNPDEALAIIHENQAKKDFSLPFNIAKRKIAEPISVKQEYLQIYGNVEVPKVAIGLKIPLKNFKTLKLSARELDVYVSIVLTALYGRTSELRDKLISGNIITDGVYASKYITDDYLIVNLVAETPYPERFIAMMKEAIHKPVLKEEDVIRKKRVAISNYILAFDDIDTVNSTIQSDIINGYEVFGDLYRIYNDLNYEVALKVVKKITDKNMAIVVLNPEGAKEK